MIRNSVCFSSMPITVQASLCLPKSVGCAVRTGTGHRTEDPQCAGRTLRSGETAGLTPAPASVILSKNAGDQN